jgi:small subunit ribosomal protein S7
MRRGSPEQRIVPPDLRYNNVNLQTMILHIMSRGKKSLATRLVYQTLDLIQEKTQKNPVEVFDTALKNVGPAMEVRPRRVGGAWILDSARERSGKSFPEKLAGELIDAANETGTAIRKRDETHKMAEANRAFSHYRV